MWASTVQPAASAASSYGPSPTTTALVGDALAEARRVAPRAAVVGDRPYDDAAEAAGWTVDAHIERPVHRSLTRHVHVLR